MSFDYSTKPVDSQRSCSQAPTEIFVPRRDYPHGYRVQAVGARVISPPTSPWVELVATSGVKQVSVTIRPGANSSTEMPTTAIDPRLAATGCPGA